MEVIWGYVRTNIDKKSLMFERLTHVNSKMKEDHEIVVEENIIEERRFFRKIIKKWYTLIHVSKYDNVVIVNSMSEREVELYLLGMMNGFVSYDLGFADVNSKPIKVD